MMTDYFIELQNLYAKNTELTEKVRLGDVMFQIESTKLTLEKLIETITEEEIVFTNNNNDTMKSYSQGKISAYKLCLEMIDYLYSDIKSKKL